MTYGTQLPPKKDSVANLASPYPFVVGMIFSLAAWGMLKFGSDFSGTKICFVLSFISLIFAVLISLIGLFWPKRKKQIALTIFLLSIASLFIYIVITPALYDHDLLAIFGLGY